MGRKGVKTDWRNRIVGHGEEPPDQLLANPKNWRTHPKAQLDALAGVLTEVGWVQDVIVNQRTGHVVDGHARVAIAISREEPSVPVVYVDLSEDEEALILATLDPLAAMAVAGKEALEALLAEVSTGDEAVSAMLAQLCEGAGVFAVDGADYPALADGDRLGFQQMTFTLSDEQAGAVVEAIKAAKRSPFGETGNENSNGNALARIAEAYRGPS